MAEYAFSEADDLSDGIASTPACWQPEPVGGHGRPASLRPDARPLPRTSIAGEKNGGAPPSQSPPGPAAKQDEDQRLQAYADLIKNNTAGMYISVTASQVFGEQIPARAFHVYLTKLLADAGDPSDPIERMMIEQLAIAHHNVGRLHVKASLADNVELIKAYNSAVTRLMAEFRRLTLALQRYRTPLPKKSVTVVQQQNIAETQQVAYVTDGAPAPDETANLPDTKLRSKGAITYAPQPKFDPQSSPGSGRKAEPIEAKRLDGRRS